MGRIKMRSETKGNIFLVIVFIIAAILLIIGIDGCVDNLKKSEISKSSYDELSALADDNEAVKDKIAECMSDGKISFAEYREIKLFDYENDKDGVKKKLSGKDK
jgi:hypothetical protein